MKTRAILAFLACGRIFALPAREEAVTIPGREIKLAATLSQPVAMTNSARAIVSTVSTVSCALLLPGSGPTDQNGNPPDMKIDLLLQIANYLAAKGVVSLRFDKRAVAKYAQLWPKKLEDQNKFFAWEHFVDDAQAAFDFLSAVKGVDGKNCAVVGHSEGGIIALALAQRRPVHTLVLLATPGRTLAKVVETQVSNLLVQQHATDKEKTFFLKENRRITEAVVQGGNVPKDVPAGLRALYPENAAKYLQTVLPLDPQLLAKKFLGRAVVINGQADRQVDPALDAKPLFAAFASRGKNNESIKLFPGLSHNFKLAHSPSDPSFAGEVPDNVLSEILRAVNDQP